MKSFNDFIFEAEKKVDGDLINILDLLKDKSTEDILDFRDTLKKTNLENVESVEKVKESLNEGFIKDVRDRFSNFVNDKFWSYLINKKKKFYSDLIGKLNIFDLKSLDDVKGAKRIESLYLAGGMDKAKDVGAGWRNVLEYEFELHGHVVDKTLPDVDLGKFGMTQPKHVVDGKYVDMFIEKPAKTKKLYDYPLLLNPVRKEVDRTKDRGFSAGLQKYKTFNQETPQKEYEPTMRNINKTMTHSIEHGDEHLVRLCSGIWLGLNTVAAAGTYAELQMTSLLNKPLFVWMTDDDWKFSDFSVWTFPAISKLCRNKQEMKQLVSTIMKYTD